MIIRKINIENYKCFKGKFSIDLNSGLNILVGDNEAGKSTILESIHLALCGMLHGKYLRNELTHYLFNNEIVNEYIAKLKKNELAIPPFILIELFLRGEGLGEFEGDGNSEKVKDCGISLKIAFDDRYKDEYEELIKSEDLRTIPIEYYDIIWTTFAREAITSRSIPIKSALIDSSSARYQNGSDVYIGRIIRDNLEPQEKVGVSQAYRKMKETFMSESAVKQVNERIKSSSTISKKTVTITVDLSTKNAWETGLITCLDDIPFHNIGKGEQCVVKTNLALDHKKSREANLILLEEPENHLSHSMLNQLISSIKNNCDGKQIIISTHSSFVANKLGLESLVLLSKQKTMKLTDLSEDTQEFFKKLSGYDTLRLLLCEKAILVEGDSDELVVQKAFMSKNKGKLPIEMGIDVISVGTSFLRFLEIAEKIEKTVSVVTDNDGDINKLEQKYNNYIGDNKKTYITICYDAKVNSTKQTIDGKPFNYNTLEPSLLRENGLDKLNVILKANHKTEIDILKHMNVKKTEVALKFFDTEEDINFPKYIMDAIE